MENTCNRKPMKGSTHEVSVAYVVIKPQVHMRTLAEGPGRIGRAGNRKLFLLLVITLLGLAWLQPKSFGLQLFYIARTQAQIHKDRTSNG